VGILHDRENARVILRAIPRNAGRLQPGHVPA
jgi:hypothetical protein